MSDLIDRQEAIGALAKVAGVGNRALDAIRALPTAEPELPIKQKCTICPHCDNCNVNDDGTIEPEYGKNGGQ